MPFRYRSSTGLDGWYSLCHGQVLGKLIQVPPSPPGLFFSDYFFWIIFLWWVWGVGLPMILGLISQHHIIYIYYLNIYQNPFYVFQNCFIPFSELLQVLRMCMAFTNFWLNFATFCNYNQLHSSAEFCRHHLYSSLISLDGFLDILGGLFSTRQLEGIWINYKHSINPLCGWHHRLFSQT